MHRKWKDKHSHLAKEFPDESAVGPHLGDGGWRYNEIVAYGADLWVVLKDTVAGND